MGKEYVYVPFKDDKRLAKMAKPWKRNTCVHAGAGSKPLNAVGKARGDILYVTAHGSVGMQSAKGSRPDGNRARARLTAANLVKRMKDDGLSPRHQIEVRLAICNGATGKHSFAKEVDRLAKNQKLPWTVSGFRTTVTKPGPGGRPLGKIVGPGGNRGTRFIDEKYTRKTF